MVKGRIIPYRIRDFPLYFAFLFMGCHFIAFKMEQITPKNKIPGDPILR